MSPMMSQPLVSVVVPTHDVAPWVAECLGSILDQSWDRLEVIVVDDHSTDGTAEIVEEIAAQDARVLLVRAEDTGGANARNVGVGIAGGELLVFADGDDLVPRDAYRSLAASLAASGSDVAVGTFLKFSSSRTWRPTGNWPAYAAARRGVRLGDHSSLIRGRAVWNKMFRTDFWRAHAIEFPEVPRSNDIVPMVTALTEAKRIDVVEGDVYLYRERPGLTSMTAKAGRYVGLASYLSQEVICLDAIEATGEESLWREFGSLFLDADGWVHLQRVLAAEPTADPDLADAVSVPLASIIRRLPATQYNRMPLQRQLIFALAAVGRLEEAAAVLASGNVYAGGPAVLDAHALSDLGRSLDGILGEEHTVWSAIYEIAVLSALRSSTDPDADEVVALAEPLVALRAWAGTNQLIPGVFGGLDVAVDAFERHDVLAVRRLARLEGDGITVARAQRLPSGRLQVSGPLHPDLAGARLAIGGRHRATRRLAVFADVRLTASPNGEQSWSAVLPRALPAAGEWDLVVVLTERDGRTCTAPLDWSAEPSLAPMLRTDRVGSVSAPAPGTRVSVIGYDELHRRVARVVIRRLGPTAQSRVHAVIMRVKGARVR